jgi:Ni,Fe-hydrogenase III component G
MPYVNKFLKTHEAKINTLLEENLTKAQQKAYEKLDETLQAQVKDEVLRNVVLTAWDEKDDELKSLVKGKVKSALDNVKE